MYKTYGLITFGGLLQGMAMGLFLFPHSIPSGGAAGIAVLLNFWFSLPLGFALWLVNFTLLVAAIKGLGNASTIGTMYAITITSLSVDFFSFDMYRPYSNEWIDLIFGVILLGIGVGILMRQQVSNGGMGVLALIIAKHRNHPPGKALFWMNGSIFIFTASIIDWSIVVQAVMCQWLSTRIVDVVYNLPPSPQVFPTMILRRK
ncbi:YitT family protein [Alkalihalobacillus sp. AL-G]|uniref:YitT family protein n=1 Tax=Alkalihalobacillus sp. AL-G TaxID=2926399 RepID=UPI00272A2C95|nr:YitT family protein [Alkalihalobacillus sp. AL-G]WLD92038.1 YitT family protein [Alkalihalobacillus sp. AL-G]